MKAEKAPSERQSRVVLGLKKLNANRMKMPAFKAARNHRP
jgi:hypothetical protein